MIPYILILISVGIIVVSFLRRFNLFGPSDFFGYSANGILLHGIGFIFLGFYMLVDPSQSLLEWLCLFAFIALGLLGNIVERKERKTELNKSSMDAPVKKSPVIHFILMNGQIG